MMSAINKTQTKNKNEKQAFRVIHIIKPEIEFTDSISTLAKSYYYVYYDVKINDVALDLEENPNIYVLAVLNKNHTIKGVVSRKDLFNILGKKYGRDIYHFQQISTLAKEVKQFKAKKNIFKIAELLNDDLHQYVNNYYALHLNSLFYGIFSTKDLLIYLSHITQIDMKLAKQVQSNIVNEQKSVTTRTFTLAGTIKMARGIGGDFYKILNYDEYKWLITICDVSGKGISAALVTGIIGGMAAAFNFKKGIKKFISKLNNYIYTTFMLEKYSTGIFLDFNEKTGIMTIFDMGHCMGGSNFYLFRNEKLYLVKYKNYNTAIGLMPDVAVKSDKIKIEPGDKLFICTDGVTDQRNTQNETYNIKRVGYILKRNKKASLDELNTIIKNDIKVFRGDYPQFDDITYIIIEY